ncbi:hypothetical protein ABE237_12365 [Brevibacillus formosus]|uniref:hypothetical protein n=1 Tax=Brevibacillus TaxID=55080 RepID=UPI000D10DC87|nr:MULTISPECIES: hypothetical protein [Brevibacillus]MBG9942093.1 hypothetical protein [Brevibacillus formosus]MED1944890.1 hypothetical protein [Brevibacillus formosus]MED1996423.1 hypothetical protein [Brevibacillus formosus]MED2081392.1 hypothetical protein [Brevibacillus formosus]PSK19793.1 hypothetical protein C7R94_06695 [Brevibacillus sp. NRRL NRS-603]
MRAREYAAKLTVNLDQLRKIERAQREVYDKGLVKPSDTKLLTALGAVASVLGLVFVASTPAGVVAGVTGIVASITPSAKDALESMVKAGYWELGYMEDYLVDNPRFNRMEIELPFIEYNVNGETIRFITGKGIILRVHNGSGWIPVD